MASDVEKSELCRFFFIDKVYEISYNSLLLSPIGYRLVAQGESATLTR